ncbi:MAG: Fe-S cluster assembly protein SufD [Alphaproteobacteria bacterium]|nr:Fe-S cluster assembly protein SufD [Alphaproteobacteria bacterium]
MAIDTANIELWGDNIPWLCGLREKGRAAFKQYGWPNAKTEAWKYSYFNKKEFEALHIDNTPHHCDCNGHCHCHEKTATPFAAYGIKFCNGKLATEDFDLPAGVSVKPLVEALFGGEAKKYLNKSFDMAKFPFAALNTALIENGLMLVIERGTKLDLPIFIYYHQHAQAANLYNIRNLIIAEKGAKATVVEYYEGSAEQPYLQNVVNEVFIADSARLNHYIWNKEAKVARHIALNSVQIRQNGYYEAFVAQSECALCRHETYIELLQKGAAAEVNGVYRLSENGKSDITTNVCHLDEHTNSHQLVKGVADGSAKAVFQGKIHIAPNAQQCEGYQQHKALLLSDEAEIDAKPELEIFADDVQCAHGNTCGDLDAEQLFYMQARGINMAEARQILIKAHTDDALGKISNKNVQNWLLEKF